MVLSRASKLARWLALGVEVLLGDQLSVIEGLGAAEVELLLLEVGFGLVDVGLSGILGGDVGGDVGPGGGDGGLLGVDGSLGLDALHAGDDVAFLNVVPLFDIEVGDATEGGGADVDVGLRLDLPGAADGGDEILAHHLAGGDLDDAGLAIEDGAGGNACEGEDNDDEDDDVPSTHTVFLCVLRTIAATLRRARQTRPVRARVAETRYARKLKWVPSGAGSG